ncbi:MAG TPA: hypothetical protein VJ694_04230 [Patescibacteria group bacterium]|nr:hypothetical protein [Patescibacteria group bacterium]
MRRAFRSGAAGRAGGRTLPAGLVSRVERDVARELRMTGQSGSSHAIRAAFFLGLQTRPGTAREASLHGVLAQQELVQAILGLTAIERHVLHADSHQMGFGDAHEWRAIYSGALAVARVAHAAMHIGLEAWLPPIGLDMHDKIDLLTFLPTTNDGLCIQVKSDNSVAETVCTPMRHDTPDAKAETDPYLRTFLRGVRIYADRTSGRWQAVFIRIGSKGALPSDLDGCADIHRPILECFMRQIPGTAAHVRVLGRHA